MSICWEKLFGVFFSAVKEVITQIPQRRSPEEQQEASRRVHLEHQGRSNRVRWTTHKSQRQHQRQP